ncbi:class I SAM-dependent methyltransferase [Micromonospora sp. NPDC051141]|uniref:class I SAM-dependent methyltransferase n=1 Tax=Micromonospora sp. NPDC051141 TaxID=3364284 RepID=UPI003793CF81
MTTIRIGRQRPPRLLELLDPAIRHDLDRVPIQAGQRVLDIGAGTGELTADLARLVGPSGKVTAVDMDTSYLAPTGVIDVYQRALGVDELPGEPGSFDVAVARWMHGALPDPDAVIRQIIDRLRPGGWLVLADIPFTPAQVFQPRPDYATWTSDPCSQDADLIQHVMTMIYSLTTGTGRPTWPLDVITPLVAAGLNPVCAHLSVETWAGGGPGCQILADTAQHLRSRLVQPELSHSDLDRFVNLMADRAVLLCSYERRTVHAHKPATPQQPVARTTRAAQA